MSVQVSIVDGSRMQEAQRVGRIQRLSGAESQRPGFFYSLVTQAVPVCAPSEPQGMEPYEGMEPYDAIRAPRDGTI